MRNLLYAGLLAALLPLPLRAQEPQSITIEAGRSIVLSGRESWQQVLVSGRHADGLTRDLTRVAQYDAVPAGVIAVDASGLVTPIKDGTATLH